MVYGEVAADGCARMDVDSRFAMGHLGDDARDKGHTEFQQLMRDAVVADGAYGGIAADYFSETMCRRVTVVGGHHIRGQCAAHFRQMADELGGNERGFFALEFGAASAFTVSREAKAGEYLPGQQVEQAFDVYADVVLDGAAVDCGIAEISGEENST